MQNNDALRQLPFLGKKTVPAALRKDLWQPLATISFPAPPQGLLAFRKLREFRKLHELSYPLEDFKDEKGRLLGKKQRGKKLMDQKANSIADIAAVLQAQEEAQEEAHVAAKAGETKLERTSPKDTLAIVEEEAAQTRRNVELSAGERNWDKVRISWANILDAEYAETWPESVLHQGTNFKDHEGRQKMLAKKTARKPEVSPEEVQAKRDVYMRANLHSKKEKVTQVM
ncbi:MAG: hypothetical protein M1812_004345 [Candelaria pacifica]|nr:MAG: hypothetical protein M1812_004345 [Candelaria pacifica]